MAYDEMPLPFEIVHQGDVVPGRVFEVTGLHATSYGFRLDYSIDPGIDPDVPFGIAPLAVVTDDAGGDWDDGGGAYGNREGASVTTGDVISGPAVPVVGREYRMRVLITGYGPQAEYLELVIRPTQSVPWAADA
jgi:hypothetical protein